MITPISLESDIEVVRRQLQQVKQVHADRFHIDIIDGLYADNFTVSPADLQQLDMTEIAVDLHLLVDDPVEWVEECIALKPARIFAQIERMGNIEYYLETVKGYGGVKAGVGLDLATPIELLQESILSETDGILLMSVAAGYSGQKFNDTVLTKISQLRKIYPGTIVVDGGITPLTYEKVLQVGASEAGANSALWHGDFEENYKNFGR